MRMYDMLRMHWQLFSTVRYLPAGGLTYLCIYLHSLGEFTSWYCSAPGWKHCVTLPLVGICFVTGGVSRGKPLSVRMGWMDNKVASGWTDGWLEVAPRGVFAQCLQLFYILSAKPWKLQVKQQRTTVVRVFLSFITACVHCLVTTPSCKISQVLADGCMLCDTFSFMCEHSFPL